MPLATCVSGFPHPLCRPPLRPAPARGIGGVRALRWRRERRSQPALVTNLVFEPTTQTPNKWCRIPQFIRECSHPAIYMEIHGSSREPSPKAQNAPPQWRPITTRRRKRKPDRWKLSTSIERPHRPDRLSLLTNSQTSNWNENYKMRKKKQLESLNSLTKKIRNSLPPGEHTSAHNKPLQAETCCPPRCYY